MICLKVVEESYKVPSLTSVFGFLIGLHWVMSIIIWRILGCLEVVISYYAMLCYAMLCCVMPCCREISYAQYEACKMICAVVGTVPPKVLCYGNHA